MYVYKIWCLVCRNIFHLFDFFLQRSDRPARQEVEDELGHERMRTFKPTCGAILKFAAFACPVEQGSGSSWYPAVLPSAKFWGLSLAMPAAML